MYLYHTYKIDSLFILHCIAHDNCDDDVAEALATTCVVNTKLRKVSILYISPLPAMKSLAMREVPLEELVIYAPWVC